MLHTVVTTIQSPTAAMRAFADMSGKYDGRIVVVGDAKGPSGFDLPHTQFLSLEQQKRSTHDLARSGPTGHYTRKNIGYLEAIRMGADCLYETDDDNAPLPNWRPREVEIEALNVESPGWVNAYRYFTVGQIWPRGLPLDEIVPSMVGALVRHADSERCRAPIQQGLANGSPDVDAVWRLVLDAPFDFDAGPSVRLAAGSWCPFNSQSTWWWPEVFPLLYLPSFCSFRMTDIWRSFVAQRCLWELGMGVVFHAPEVVQDRNLHNLMRDFEDEIPGYRRNRELVQVLEETNLLPGAEQVAPNLERCYRALVAKGFFSTDELKLIADWRADLEKSLGGC